MTGPIEIEILVERVDQKIKELFGVLLPIDHPLPVHATAEVPEGGRLDYFRILLPHRPHQVGIQLRHDAIGSFPVLLLLMLLVLIIFQKECRQRHRR